MHLEYQTTLTLNHENNHGGICTVYIMSTCLLQTKSKAILGVLPYYEHRVEVGTLVAQTCQCMLYTHDDILKYNEIL